jgi:hypothetical protein
MPLYNEHILIKIYNKKVIIAESEDHIYCEPCIEITHNRKIHRDRKKTKVFQWWCGGKGSDHLIYRLCRC